jgi:hypothetical protein
VRRFDPPGLLAVLRAAAHGGTDLTMSALDDRLVRWAVDTGLGPLLLRTAAHDPEAATSPLWPLVKGADLTARVLTAQQIEATTELIDACRGLTPPLVLLKGISICEQHYPDPHLRPMRDIDVLIEEDAVATVEAILAGRGYRPSTRKPAAHYAGHHHGRPLVHPDTGVWVEVHRALCSLPSGPSGDDVLGLANLRTQLRPSQFRTRPVRRLSDELQIVHLACHWAEGLPALVRTGSLGGMIAMADLAFLLNDNPAVRWDRILTWLDGALAARSVYLLLTYLDTRHIIRVPPGILGRMRARQPLGGVALRIAHAMIDRYVVDGHDLGPLMSARAFTRIWRTLVLRRLPSSPAPGPRVPVEGLALPVAGRSGRTDAGREPEEGEMTSRTTHPRRRADLRHRLVEGEMVVLDRERQVVHQLNQTAHYIWERCDGAHSPLEIAAELAHAFDVDAARAVRDVRTALRQLETAGLVSIAEMSADG